MIAFFHSHNVRRADVVEHQVDAIKSEMPLTSDPAVIEPARLIVAALLPQLQTLSAGNASHDTKIAARCRTLPDYQLFAELPGAEPVFAFRLLAAFGEQRNRFVNAAAFQKFSGVAPRHPTQW